VSDFLPKARFRFTYSLQFQRPSRNPLLINSALTQSSNTVMPKLQLKLPSGIQSPLLKMFPSLSWCQVNSVLIMFLYNCSESTLNVRVMGKYNYFYFHCTLTSKTESKLNIKQVSFLWFI